MSKRDIKISAALSLELKKYKFGNPLSACGLMFPNSEGQPSDRKTTWTKLNRAVQKANQNEDGNDKIPQRTVHSLRHFFASRLLADYVPVPEVSRIIGHSNPNVTMTVYAHWYKSEGTYSPDKVFEQKVTAHKAAE